MKVLVVGLVGSRQLLRLREEAERRGHQVEGCYTTELVIEAGPGYFRPALRTRPLEAYQVIFFWALDARKWEWFCAAEHLHRHYGTHVVNRRTVEPGPRFYSTPAHEYKVQVEHGLRFPRSALISSERSLDRVLSQFNFPVIVKGSRSRQGKGVYLAQDVREVRALVREKKRIYPALIIREYIPNDGDIRVFTVGYRAIGAMKRVPPKGDFRSNISQGGKGEPYDLGAHPEVRWMAETASRELRVEVAGVDIMVHSESGLPFLLEVNAGPQIRGIERYTGTNVAGAIIEYFESLVTRGAPVGARERAVETSG